MKVSLFPFLHADVKMRLKRTIMKKNIFLIYTKLNDCSPLHWITIKIGPHLYCMAVKGQTMHDSTFVQMIISYRNWSLKYKIVKSFIMSLMVSIVHKATHRNKTISIMYFTQYSWELRCSWKVDNSCFSGRHCVTLVKVIFNYKSYQIIV